MFQWSVASLLLSTIFGGVGQPCRHSPSQVSDMLWKSILPIAFMKFGMVNQWSNLGACTVFWWSITVYRFCCPLVRWHYQEIHIATGTMSMPQNWMPQQPQHPTNHHVPHDNCQVHPQPWENHCTFLQTSISIRSVASMFDGQIPLWTSPNHQLLAV